MLWVGIIISTLFYMLTVVFEWEVFEEFCELMMLFEAYELDELIIPLLILNCFLVIYVFQLKKETSIDSKKSKIHLERLQHLAASDDVMSAILDQMKQLKSLAQNSEVDPEWQIHTDKLIQEVITSAEKLTMLMNVEGREIQRIIRGN